MATPKFVRPRSYYFWIFVALACVCLESTAAARAGSITYSTETESVNPTTLPFFDPKLGTLHEVLFYVTMYTTAELEFPEPVTSVVLTGGASINAYGGPNGGLFAQFSSPGNTETIYFDPSTTFSPVALYSDFGASYESGLDLFQQQGSYIVYPFGQFQPSIGEINPNYKSISDATVTVTYFYGAPEPPSAILLALGLMPVLIIGVYKARSLSAHRQSPRRVRPARAGPECRASRRA
jgi:hypothetical protein